MATPKLLFTLDQPHGNGELYFTWQKGESRSLLATTGTDATVAVHDRTGELVERIKLQGLCAGMEWDNDGDNLAIITPNSNSVLLWESHTNTRLNIETGLKEPPSCIAWACDEPLLAIGTQKGNLALYNHHTTKRIPIIGKHSKRITTAAWNKDGALALGSDDKTLSISNSDGDTLRTVALRDAPGDVQFSEMKTDERARGENTISLVVGKRILYLYNLLNPENPIELAFQQRYGAISAHRWYGDGYILLGFSAGFVISISTHMKEVGEELFQVQCCRAGLSDVALCGSGLAAVCGDGQVKFLSVWNNGEVSATLTPPGGAERGACSADGRLLATAGKSYLSVYVTSLPALGAALGTRAAALTSLREATVYQCVEAGDDGAVCSCEYLSVHVTSLPALGAALGTRAAALTSLREATVYQCVEAGDDGAVCSCEYLSVHVTSLPALGAALGTRAAALTSLREATVYQCVEAGDDGAVCSCEYLSVHVTSLPALGAALGTRAAALTSLREATVYQCVEAGDDGAVCSCEYLSVHVTSLPALGAALGTRAAALTSLREATVYQCVEAGDDGAVCSCEYLSVHVTSLPALGAALGTRAAALTSLREATVYQCVEAGDDGAVCSCEYLSVHVTSLPALGAALGTRAAALTSLREATVYQCVEAGDDGAVCSSEPVALATYALPAEPAHLALGARHVGCARDAQVFYVPLAGGAARRRAAAGDVTKLVMAGDYAAYMFAGKAVLHMIDEPPPAECERELTTFPPPPHDARVTDIQLTADFFIYVTDRGDIHHWSVVAWRPAAHYRHGAGWAACAADPVGARAAVTDERGRSFIYIASSGELVPNPHLLEDCKGILWELSAERHVLVCWGGGAARTLSAAGGAGGARVLACADTPLAGARPLLLFAGELYCCGAGGSMSRLTLQSHAVDGLAAADGAARAAARRAHAARLTRLRRLPEAWAACAALDEEAAWRSLGEAAIDDLNIEFAIRVYTRLSDVAMVWALQDVAHCEELPLLCGLLSAWLSRGDTAARWLAGAAEGAGAAGAGAGAEGAGAGEGAGAAAAAAAALARARGDWAAASQAGPAYARAHAQHLEITGDHHAALARYEQALIPSARSAADRRHNAACEAGVARCAVRCADYMRAVALAMRLSDDRGLLVDCAEMLEEERQWLHAATLHEQAGNTERAALLYIKLKSWSKVEALLPKITSPSVHIQYAKAKEAEGRYAEALKSYIIAQDYESAIRLNLEKLDDVDEAVALVQETKSVQGAKMVAGYFQSSNDQTSAVKFLVMSLCYDEAFQLARRLGQLQLYGEILIQTSQARPEDFRSLALHFEGEKNGLLAGKFYFHAGDHAKAMGHLLKVSGGEELEDEAMSVAIDAAAASDDERLTRRLIDHLLGETDGAPKDPRHLFRLYMAKKQYDDAAKTAVLISRSLCASGQYRAARAVLRRAVTAASRAPPELAPLHRYMLVRTHVRRGRHDLAAQLLVRLAADLDVFPTLAHQVSILTSTVIECGRAGLKHDALHCARALMQPQYRPHIDPKYVSKIESCVRHGVRGAREPGPGAPCPVCGGPVPRAELRCARCEAVLPFCIATGLHVEKDDLTACPECDFPAIHSEFVELLKDEGKCPMCDEAVDYQRLVKIEDIGPYLHLNTSAGGAAP